jgi:lysyl-tRNA synthetase class II
MNDEFEVTAQVAALHATSPQEWWNAADDLLDAARVLFPPRTDHPPTESVQILAGIARLLQRAPFPAVLLYTHRAKDAVPPGLRPQRASGPPEADVLLLALTAAALGDAEPWPMGIADSASLQRAVTAMTGPIACRTLALRLYAMLFLLQKYPQVEPAHHSNLLRRLVWLTDPRTEDPRDLLLGLTAECDPLAPAPLTTPGRAAIEPLAAFPLADWARTDGVQAHVRLGGRILNIRRHRTVTFADLGWAGQTMQLCLEPAPGAQLRPGDLIVVAGRIGSTGSGRNALFAEKVEHHCRGTALRHPDTLHCTAILSAIRRYLQDTAFIEVVTPVLSDDYRGGASRPFTTWAHAAGRSQYLRVTTEPALLELIACGTTRCYEIGASFRNEGLRGQRIKEFTMLEAYSADLDRQGMLQHVTGLIAAAGPTAPTLRHTTFDAAFEQISGAHPSDTDAVCALAATHIPEFASRTQDPDQLARRLWRNHLRGRLTGLVAITDIPGPSSPLIEGEGRAAQRTWLYLHGIEIAEISSNERRPQVLAAAFSRQFAADRHAVHRDYQHLIAVFEAGLPPVVGVGLGLTRLAQVINHHSTFLEQIP